MAPRRAAPGDRARAEGRPVASPAEASMIVPAPGSGPGPARRGATGRSHRDAGAPRWRSTRGRWRRWRWRVGGRASCARRRRLASRRAFGSSRPTISPLLLPASVGELPVDEEPLDGSSSAGDPQARTRRARAARPGAVDTVRGRGRTHLGRCLRAARGFTGLSAVRASAQLGVDRGPLGDWETGDR